MFIFHRARRIPALIVLSCILFSAEPGLAQSDIPVLPEQPPMPNTVRYAPADSTVSTTDPVAFLWLPVEGSREYTLQCSRSPDFDGLSAVTVSTNRTIYVPRKVLGQGRWYWRFGVKDASTGKIKYSRSRTFTIARKAAEVPFPDVRKTIGRLTNMRPRDFVHPADLNRYRRLAAGPLNNFVRELKIQCDKYLDQPMLPEPEFLPPGGEERTLAYVDIFHKVRTFNGIMSDCATVYLLTGDPKYGHEARRRLLHVAGWDPEGSTNLFHNDEPGTSVIRFMSRTYDWVFPLLSNDDKEIVRHTLAIRIPQLFKILTDEPFEIHPYSSHDMDYYIGDLLEACICMAGELPVEEMFEYVLQQLWSPYFPPYGGDDGGWSEGPSYWQWSTETFLRNFLLVKQNTGVDLTKKAWVQNTPFYKLYANPPYSKMSPFGDEQATGPSSSIMYKLGLTVKNPYAIWYGNQLKYGKLRELDQFLYYVPGRANGKPPTDLPQARCFFDVGLACMHSDLADSSNNVQFLLRSSPFGSISHSYADQNAFTLSAYGEPLAIASGYYPYYGSPHHVQWTWQTKASNSLLVDGKGQKPHSWQSKGRITRFATNSYAHFATGDATEAYDANLTRFLRHSFFLRPVVPGADPVIVLYDDIASPVPAKYDWLLHSLDKMTIDSTDKTVYIRHGIAGLKVIFLAPQELNFSQTDQFSVKPENEKMNNQWHLTVRTTTASLSSGFITVLVPDRKDHKPRLLKARTIDKPGWVIVELTDPNTTQIIAFRSGAVRGERLNIENLSTTADYIAASFDKNGKKLGILEVKNNP